MVERSRPWTFSASFKAASTASDPAEPRNTISRSPGAMLARFLASALAYWDIKAIAISWRFSS
jgi:hypothetical protein